MPTILTIDDDVAMRDSLAETLADLGHLPVTKASGQLGLDHLRSHIVDAVLLDLRMPGLDGIEVLNRIQASADPPHVCVLTAFATAANTIEAVRIGAFDHFTKPIGRQHIADLLERMLRRGGKTAVAPLRPTFDDIVGPSAATRCTEVHRHAG